MDVGRLVPTRAAGRASCALSAKFESKYQPALSVSGACCMLVAPEDIVQDGAADLRSDHNRGRTEQIDYKSHNAMRPGLHYLRRSRDLKDLHGARDDVLDGLLSDPTEEHRGDLSQGALGGLLTRSRGGAGGQRHHKGPVPGNTQRGDNTADKAARTRGQKEKEPFHGPPVFPLLPLRLQPDGDDQKV
ncbi:hypothetical protein EYF80_037437 [Liparis tanakae]|uniref:Uncharacterized protein n=1 Tax=Liparis tanakae TaxID=230148 RepID=A0A4Z2GHW3_9TELE|nr:hypothetical protein EYF80_037437 [Liparis tanakae]